MNIPADIIWEIGLVLGGIIFGKLWQHEGKLNKRVTYEHCTKNRDKCPCIQEIEGIRKKLEHGAPDDNNYNRR